MSPFVDTSVWSLALRRDAPENAPEPGELRPTLREPEPVVTFGVFVYTQRGVLAGLELWSIDGTATPATLPDPSAWSVLRLDCEAERGH